MVEINFSDEINLENIYSNLIEGKKPRDPVSTKNVALPYIRLGQHVWFELPFRARLNMSEYNKRDPFSPAERDSRVCENIREGLHLPEEEFLSDRAEEAEAGVHKGVEVAPSEK